MLFANDANKERAKAIVGNIHRMGITNTVVSDYDGRTFPTVSVIYVSNSFLGSVLSRLTDLYEFVLILLYFSNNSDKCEMFFLVFFLVSCRLCRKLFCGRCVCSIHIYFLLLDLNLK